jgi:transglutaminase-like putative cysteine protease
MLWLPASGLARADDDLQGDWFIVSGKSKISTSIADHPLLKDSAQWVKDGAEVRILATPAASARFVRLTHGAWWGYNLPSTLWDKHVELTKADRDIEAVALMAQGGWAILYDKAHLATDSVPESIRAALQTAINDLKKSGPASTPHFLAFASDGGWVLLADRDYREHGLPRALSQRLAEHKQMGVAVRCVAFNSQSDWFLIDNHNECYSSNTGHAAFRKLNSLQAAGEQLRLITFTPGHYSHGYVLDQRPVRRIRATLSLNLQCEGGSVDRWAIVPPVFPELPRQRAVKVTLTPSATPVEDGGPLRQTVQIIRVTDKPQGFEAAIHSDLTLYTNRLVPRLASQAPSKVKLTQAEAKVFTQVTDDMTTRVFKDYLAQHQLHRGSQESDLAFARRTFLHISRNFTYIFPNIEGQDVLQCGKGDCGGLSWAFIRILRANGVPARLLLGHWAETEVPAKDGMPPDGRCHAKAEFFVQGTGWVDADLSGGVGSGDARLAWFGNEAGDFVVTDLDTERLVSIWPEDRPGKLGGTQGFFWWYQGNEGKGIRTSEHWIVKTLDANPQR